MRERLYVTESRPEGRYYKEEFDPPSHYSSFSGALGPQMVGDKPEKLSYKKCMTTACTYNRHRFRLLTV